MRKKDLRNSPAPAPQAGAPPFGQDSPPRDIAEIRLLLMRRITDLTGASRRCPLPACRRHRRCVGVPLVCYARLPSRPLSPEKEAAALAHVRRQLQKRLAEMEAARGEG